MKSRNASSITEIAESVFEEVAQCFANQKEYFIVGHSFGSLIGLRIAAMLEKTGKVGRLVSIDGSPEYLFRLANGICQSGHVEGNIENDLFMILFSHFCKPESVEDFVKGLRACNSTSSKFECLSEYVSSEYKDKYSTEYLQNITVALLNRLRLIVEKDIMDNILDTKLKFSKITLIRPTQISFADINEDYTLSKYSELDVTVKYVDGHHVNVLENIELTNILNEIISPDASE